MKKVFIFLADGFEEIEAIAPIDILRRAELDVVTVSISDSKTVTGAHGIKVEADQLFTETTFGENDYYVLPGGYDGMLNLSAHFYCSRPPIRQPNRQSRCRRIEENDDVNVVIDLIPRGKRTEPLIWMRT